MEKFEELIQNAQRRIHVADHMLTQTYPLIKDPKLLLSVVENTFLSLSYAMSALLYYERLFKRVPLFADTFDAKIEVFKEKVLSRYGIAMDYIILLNDMKEIIVKHRESPVEFVRQDRFVICSDNYKMKTIDVAHMKKYISSAKNFIREVAGILEQQVKNARSY